MPPVSTEWYGDGPNLRDRMTEIENQNQLQKEEISSLKIVAVKDRKAISELSIRVARLEAAPKNNYGGDKVLEREKRPYRLLPTDSLR